MNPADNARDAHLPPVEVWRACVLIAASLVLSLVLLVPGVAPVLPGQAPVPPLYALTVFAVFGALTLWLALRVLQRRRWARWAMLAYLAVSWLLALPGVADDFVAAPMAACIEALCIALEWVACAYLFFGRGAAWFAGSSD